ncbi:1705_t:CDS:2 [Diversispora eburnea]|uniref:1705_t:CDS:1 n=1 Tax=Diversispora eburnea TaxID=1213867 RepID=A0A9N9BMM4_9GLOM|nr:1705_t:CDS:2 [Diversispora eburnea]
MALKLQPNNAKALKIRCECYKVLMDSENALKDLDELCNLESENEHQFELRGAILLDMQKWNDSQINLNQAIKSQPNNVATISNRAKLYCKLRQYGLALKDTHEGTIIDPRNLVIRQQTMDLYRRNHQYGAALGEAEVALSIDPKNINTLLIRADIYFLMRKYNTSLMDLNEAIRISPRNSFVLIAQSELFCKKKYYKDALYYVQCALRIKSANNYALEVRGNIYRKQHKYEKALVDFNKSLELCPLDMILEHNQNQGDDIIEGGNEGGNDGGGKDGINEDDKDGSSGKVGINEGSKVGINEGGKVGINEGGKDGVSRNNVGYDKGFVVTHQIFGERNFSSIYYRRGDTYCKLGMYELALEDFNRALELANGYFPIHKKREYVLSKLERLDDTPIKINDK